MTPKFNRILLKLSGEVLAGEQGHGFDFDVIETICDSIAKVVDMGVSVGIVIGGGNFWRGRSSGSMDRCRADSIGMLGTVMNSIAVADTLIAKGVEAKVYSAVAMEPIAEIFKRSSTVARNAILGARLSGFKSRLLTSCVSASVFPSIQPRWQP